MEILSINFAIFVVQLAFCIVPLALGIRLFTFSIEFKEDTRRKLSDKLLKDPNLIKSGFFNFALYSIACSSLLFGLIVALYIIFVVLPK